jgi:hypothetical protein
MYYLEDLSLRDINFLSQLLEDYRKTNTAIEDGKPLPLLPTYHSLKTKVKRLIKYASYNPFEKNTPKRPSKYSEFKKTLHKKTYKMKKEIIKEKNNETTQNTQETKRQEYL